MKTPFPASAIYTPALRVFAFDGVFQIIMTLPPLFRAAANRIKQTVWA
jgi:hypothetical protein